MRISLAYCFAGLVATVGCSNSTTPGAATPDAPGSTPGDAPGDSTAGDAGSTGNQPPDGSGPITVGNDGCFDGVTMTGPAPTGTGPHLGAHGMRYCKYMSNLPATLAGQVLTTQANGSTILVNIGRGDASKFVAPSDDKGNTPYKKLDMTRAFADYPNSGTAVYSFTNAVGGPDFQVTTPTGYDGTTDDEVTLAVVEVVGGTHIQDIQWNQPSMNPLKSASVKTTAAATLVAFWWGNAFPDTPQSAIPDSGFTAIDYNTDMPQKPTGFVQAAVAVKNVTAPGTYDVTWTATPDQAAQLWLIAVQ